MIKSVRIVTGAIIGGIVGHLWMTYGATPLPVGYVPQTQWGVVSETVGRALPWALIGAILGYFWAYRKKA
jgi:hypothetical protein